MEKTLITGGAGFLGSHLCDLLLSKGHQVICMDNLITGSLENISHIFEDPNFKCIKYDVTEYVYVKKNVDNILHFASPASPIDYLEYPIQTLKVGSLGTHKVLGLAKEKKARFLLASTSEIYGDPLEHPQQEEYWGNVNPIGPRGVYDEAKRFGETLVAYFIRDKGIDARIARIFNTYGSRMKRDDMRMVVSFINQALEGKPITVFGKGDQTRSLCYIEDTVDGLIKLMFGENTKGEVINIGSDEEYSVLEYAQIIKKLIDSASEIVFSEVLPADDPMRRKPDIGKAKKILKWEPKIRLEEGLKKFIAFYK